MAHCRKPRLTSEYRSYIRSDAWQRVSQECKRRDGWRCVLCLGKVRLEAHHWRYPANIANTTIGDLITLCHKCHRQVKREGNDRLGREELIRRYARRVIRAPVQRVTPLWVKRVDWVLNRVRRMF